MELQAHCDRLRKKEEYPQLHTTSEHWTRVENLSLPNYLPPLSHSLPMRYHCAGITSETEVLKVFEAFRDRGRFTIYIASLWLLHILLAMNRIGIEEYRINLESSQLRCRLNINLIFFFFFSRDCGWLRGWSRPDPGLVPHRHRQSCRRPPASCHLRC